MSRPWPPPPDIDSIRELVATADIEAFIADGSPADEYEMEAEELFEAIREWSTADLTAVRLEPVITDIWVAAFSLEPSAMDCRKPQIAALAGQIARFFGPAAKPRVRGEA